MRILVDTHIFLWIFRDEPRFSKKAESFFEDVSSNEFFLSDVSVWEASIKYGQGKLKLPEAPEQFFPDRVRRAGYRHLPIDLNHVSKVHALPAIHGDPFDRLLISQATLENMFVVSEDPVFARYGIDLLRLSDIS